MRRVQCSRAPPAIVQLDSDVLFVLGVLVAV